MAAVSEPVRLLFLWRPAVRDPDDDTVLEAAVNGRANAIVTFNSATSARWPSASVSWFCRPVRR
ncbi:PIN domain-containing protein [Mesorhizobium sp. BR1-1-2]|uniref:PIN domain-containing protein n=1 Tax=Mesorhizobium sp. BR1-1-2 TaxID=2876652 RepID=UPI001CCCAFDD|nr:PIN domain-containing protein [Mesorhizobium sp. BR1-1-2]MBZ9967015.1 PIN domain-containing protein [Mesorhizobium sp. BR1-1-2]